MTTTNKTMRTMPEGRTEVTSNFCSNFDGVIDQDTVKLLLEEKHYADYPAWEWHGTVWYEAKQFHCAVYRHHSHIGTISAESAGDLKELLCDSYGNE